VSDWLVPISRYLRFAQANGRTVRSGFDALQPVALNGRLAKVECEVRGPLVDVGAGDEVWFYSPEHEVGVFAVGRARRPTTTKKKATVTITIDKPRTRVFAADPFPAATMRRWVPELRAGSVNLDIRPRAKVVLDGWQHERGERDVELLAPLGATPWRQVARTTAGTPPPLDDVLGPIGRLLRSQDFALGLLAGGGPEPLLVARRVRDVVIIEVERNRGARARDEALESVGALRERRWRLEREPQSDLRLRGSIWIAFTGKPHDDLAAFLDDDEILVSWLQRAGVVELTDRSKQRWYQYLGIR
jgi:hypothetical protein